MAIFNPFSIYTGAWNFSHFSAFHAYDGVLAIGIFETNMRNNAHKNKTKILSKSKLYSWLEMG